MKRAQCLSAVTGNETHVQIPSHIRHSSVSIVSKKMRAVGKKRI